MVAPWGEGEAGQGRHVQRIEHMNSAGARGQSGRCWAPPTLRPPFPRPASGHMVIQQVRGGSNRSTHDSMSRHKFISKVIIITTTRDHQGITTKSEDLMRDGVVKQCRQKAVGGGFYCALHKRQQSSSSSPSSPPPGITLWWHGTWPACGEVPGSGRWCRASGVTFRGARSAGAGSNNFAELHAPPTCLTCPSLERGKGHLLHSPPSVASNPSPTLCKGRPHTLRKQQPGHHLQHRQHQRNAASTPLRPA